MNDNSAIARRSMATLKTLALVSFYQTGAVILLSLLSLWILPGRAFSVLVGGMLMAVNFFALRFLTLRTLTALHSRWVYALALGAKFIVVLSLMAVFILVLHLDVLGFALGMSTLLLGIALACVHQALIKQNAPSSVLN